MYIISNIVTHPFTSRVKRKAESGVAGRYTQQSTQEADSKRVRGASAVAASAIVPSTTTASRDKGLYTVTISSMQELLKKYTELERTVESFKEGDDLLLKIKQIHAEEELASARLTPLINIVGSKEFGKRLKIIQQLVNKGDKALSGFQDSFAEKVEGTFKKALEKGNSIDACILSIYDMLDSYGGAGGCVEMLSFYKKKLNEFTARIVERNKIVNDPTKWCACSTTVKEYMGFLDQIEIEMSHLVDLSVVLVRFKTESSRYKRPFVAAARLEEIPRDDLLLHPEKYLERICEEIRRLSKEVDYENINLIVTFKGEIGQDVGGLSREFLQLLFKGLFINPDGSKKSLFAIDKNIIPMIAFLMRYVFEQSELTIGKWIDESMFKVLWLYPPIVFNQFMGIASKSFWASHKAIVESFSHPLSMMPSIARAFFDAKSPSEAVSYGKFLTFLENCKNSAAYTDEIEECASMAEEVLKKYNLADGDKLAQLKIEDVAKYRKVIVESIGMLLWKVIEPQSETAQIFRGVFEHNSYIEIVWQMLGGNEDNSPLEEEQRERQA